MGGPEIRQGNRKIGALTRNGTGEIVCVFMSTIHSIALEGPPPINPNTHNVGLGTGSRDDDAGEEKRTRTIQTAKNATSFETTSVWLTGFQVIMQ